MTELVVASFNLRNARAFDGWHSWPFRRSATAALARRLDADLLGVQEAYACQARYLSRRLPGTVRFGRGRDPDGGGEQCAVYVRPSRVAVRSVTTRWFDVEGARFPRLATIVEAAEVVFVDTHLDERSAARRLASVSQLVSWLDPTAVPTVVVGDFNATPEREPALFSVLAGAGLRPALPDDGRGTFHRFEGGTDGPRIDHLYVSRHWTVLDAAVVTADGRLPSDHWPIRAHLRTS